MAYIAEPYAPPQPVLPPKVVPPDPFRFSSIDALKGIAILSLWLVNASLPDSAIPSQLKPGPWGHPTFADCIFPALLVAIGAGLALSAAYRSKGRESMGQFMMSSASRAFWLFLFGVIVDCAVARQPVFQLGALQLMSLAYLINALFARTPIVLRVFVAEGILLAFYGWVKMTPVPGSLIGTFSEDINLVHYYNNHVLNANNLQGLLALVPMTSIIMSGSVIGSLYVLDTSFVRRGLIFIACGATLIFFGWLWSLDMAMSSAIWTSSFALYATGCAIAALGVFNLAFDYEKGERVAYVFAMPGRSILLAIVGPILLKTMILDVWRWPGSEISIGEQLKTMIASSTSAPMSNWIYPIGMVVLWWAVLAITYHRRHWLRSKCD